MSHRHLDNIIILRYILRRLSFYLDNFKPTNYSFQIGREKLGQIDLMMKLKEVCYLKDDRK